MGDENTLAGTTKRHKHTSPASDGGFLETTETGVTNMSEGSIGYYDSSSVMQEISIASASDQLRVNAGATAPEWFTPSGGGVALARQYITNNTSQSTTSASMVDIVLTSGITLQAGAGMAMCNYATSVEGGSACYFRWDFSTDGTQSEMLCNSMVNHLSEYNIQGLTSTLSSQTVVCQYRCYTAGTTGYVQRDNYNGIMYILEIS